MFHMPSFSLCTDADKNITIAQPQTVINEIIENKEDIYDEKSREVQEKMAGLDEITDTLTRFIEYKDLVNEYSGWFDPPETVYDYFNEDEVYIIQRCVETETFEKDFDSKVNVANVIFNRIEHEDFDDTAIEVVTKKKQFAYGRKIISYDTVLAVEYAFQFGDTTQGALYFHSNKKTDKFYGADYLFTDDAGHHFYGYKEVNEEGEG